VAAPSYVNASTGSTDATGAWSHTSAAPAAAGNILLVQVLQDGTAADVAIDSVTNAENLAGTDNILTKIGEFNVGSAVAASQHLWIGRALSTSAMVITGSNAGGDDVYVRVYEFKDVNTGTAITDVIENGTAGSTANSAGTGTTVSDAAVTTLGVDRLILNLVAANDDVAIAAFTGETGGDWREMVAEYVDAGGTDGMLQLQASYPGAAAYFGGTTALGNIFGATGSAEMQAQSFASGAGGTVTNIILYARKTLAPTDDLVVEIQTDSAGVPSGTAVGSSASVNGTALTTTFVPTSFPVSATLSASTTYWIVMRRSGARDTSNFFGPGGTTGNPYAGGTQAERTSGTWATAANDFMFAVQYGSGTTIDGGTATIVSAAWGACGFALIGTTSAPPATPLSLVYDSQPLRHLRAR
jgi:hypothetical protein